MHFSEEAFHLVLAGGVGVIGGLVNLVFYYATESVKTLFLRQPGDPVEVAEMMGKWERVLTPTLGGFVPGWCCIGVCGWPGRNDRATCWRWWWRGTAGCRSAARMVKFMSSLVTIGSGGSIGREGGITQLVGDARFQMGAVGQVAAVPAAACWWAAGRRRALRRPTTRRFPARCLPR